MSLFAASFVRAASEAVVEHLQTVLGQLIIEKETRNKKKKTSD
jgi:hypothetical protein